AELLRNAGFDEDSVPQMVCAAKWESSFFTKALHKNRNGSVDYGLFQINDRLWAGKCGFTVPELYVPANNTQCAKMIFDHGGWRNWYGSRNHKRECDAFTLPPEP